MKSEVWAVLCFSCALWVDLLKLLSQYLVLDISDKCKNKEQFLGKVLWNTFYHCFMAAVLVVTLCLYLSYVYRTLRVLGLSVYGFVLL